MNVFNPEKNTVSIRHIVKSPKLYITPRAMCKMNTVVALSNQEVGWLGVLSSIDGKDVMYDIYIPEQKVHSTTCEITQTGLMNLALEITSADNGLDIWNNLRVWGHSHVNMGTSPSGQDEIQLDELSKDADFFYSIICNKKEAMSIFYYDKIKGLIFEKVPWELFIEEEPVIREEISEILKKNVSQIAYSTLDNIGKSWGDDEGFQSNLFRECYNPSKTEHIPDRVGLSIEQFEEDNNYYEECQSLISNISMFEALSEFIASDDFIQDNECLAIKPDIILTQNVIKNISNLMDAEYSVGDYQEFVELSVDSGVPVEALKDTFSFGEKSDDEKLSAYVRKYGAQIHTMFNVLSEHKLMDKVIFFVCKNYENEDELEEEKTKITLVQQEVKK